MNKKLVALCFVLSLALIAVMDWIAYRNMVMLVETGDVITQTLKIITSINALESRILAAESASRGFIITGSSRHRRRFDLASQKINDLFVQLRHLTRDDPTQQSNLTGLKSLVKTNLALLNRSIGPGPQPEKNLEHHIAMTDAGRATRDHTRLILGDMEKYEEQRLWQRYVQRTKSAQRSLWDLVGGTIVSFAILTLAFCYLNREISGRSRAEVSLQRANRTLKTLSESNQALIRATDETSFLQELCRILVREGGYLMAWVGLAEQNGEKTVRPLAIYGVDDGYLAATTITWADEPSGWGPSGTAIRTGEPCISRNIQQDQSFAPWRVEALKRNFASTCAMPLKNEESTWGSLNLYAREADAFDPEEVKLLEALAQDLEYGLEVLRDRVKHQRAAAALAASEAQYRQLVDRLNHGLITMTPEGVVSLINPKMSEILGYPRHEIIGHRVFDFIEPAQQEFVRDQLARHQRGENTPYEMAWTRNDGQQIIVLVTPFPIFDQRGELETVLGVITDISDRKRAEAEAEKHLHSLNLLISGVEKLTKLREPDSTVQEICQLVVDAFDPRLVWLGRVDSPDCLRALYWAGEAADCLLNRDFCLDDPCLTQGPISRAIQTGEPALVNDIRQEATDTPWVAADLERGYSSLAAFPLLSGTQVFACLNIYSGQIDFFTPSRVELLHAFAGIAMAALGNAQLNTKVEKHLKQLQALRQIDLAINSSLDLRVTLNVLLDQLIGLLRVDAATVLLLDSHAPSLKCAAARGFHTSPMDWPPVPLGKGCAGAVALERKPKAFPEMSILQNDCARYQLFAQENFVSYYGVPLINKGQVRGVVELLHRSRLEPDEEMREFLEAVTSQAAIAIDNANLVDEMQSANLELSLAYEATLEGWAKALELRDFETKGHSGRVTELTVKLAQVMGVKSQDIIHIYRGALLHDIGKIAVPDRILLKPGPLTPEEWVVMRQHPIYAYELLHPIAYLRPALDIPFCHHERWDGRGYPRGLRGSDIPLAARIFAVADVWDALGSVRSYRDPWPQEEIVNYLKKQAGLQFDPAVVQAFLEIIPQLDSPAPPEASETALSQVCPP